MMKLKKELPSPTNRFFIMNKGAHRMFFCVQKSCICMFFEKIKRQLRRYIAQTCMVCTVLAQLRNLS